MKGQVNLADMLRVLKSMQYPVKLGVRDLGDLKVGAVMTLEKWVMHESGDNTDGNKDDADEK